MYDPPAALVWGVYSACCVRALRVYYAVGLVWYGCVKDVTFFALGEGETMRAM